MEKLNEATKNTLKAMVNEMSQHQLVFALTMIIDGLEIAYSIDFAYACGRRNHNKKVKE